MIGSLVRRALAHRGYVLWKRNFMRFGVDPLLDIARLSRTWGQTVETVFDVGANAGQFQHQAETAFPGSYLYSFEPHPDTYRHLCEAVTSPRARCYQLALGDTCGRVPFYVYGTQADGSLMNSLTPDAGFALRGGWKPEKIEVESITLDALCKRERIERIDILKLDTEGFDLTVLKGGERMLRERRVNFVYTEFNDLLDRPGVTGGSLLPIAQFLATLGLRYVATYTDFVQTDGPMWLCANALFARDPRV
jgi:FkbM family methyltransferase